MKTYKEFLSEAVKFDSAPYKKKHGKDPKGEGAYAFSDKLTTNVSGVFFAPDGDIKDAMKAAEKKFPKSKVIYILP